MKVHLSSTNQCKANRKKIESKNKIKVTEHESKTVESAGENFEMYAYNSLSKSFRYAIAGERSWSLRIFSKNSYFKISLFLYDFYWILTLKFKRVIVK